MKFPADYRCSIQKHKGFYRTWEYLVWLKVYYYILSLGICMYILKWQKEKRDRFCVGSEKGSVLTCWSAPDDSPALRQQQSSVFFSIFHSLSPFYCYYGLFGCCSIRPYTTSWLEWVNEILTNFVFSLASIAYVTVYLNCCTKKEGTFKELHFFLTENMYLHIVW